SEMQVAVKVWKIPADELTPDRRRKFYQECRLMRQLSDQSDRVVGFRWSGIPPNGSPWLAMDLYESSLEDLLAPGPVPVELLMCVVDDLLAGLAAIHVAGHVHRDIKPANVLLKQGRAAVSDFGIAMALDSWTQDTTAGTLGFLAPEVIAGSAPTPVSDVYSAAQTILAAAPPVLPGWLDSLLTRASSQNVKDRPKDAADLLGRFRSARGARDAIAPAQIDSATGPTHHPPGLAATHAGRRRHFPAGRDWTIGRGSDVDLRIEDELVSRRHAVVAFADGWTVTDLDSTNGLWVAGSRVTHLRLPATVTVHLGGPKSPAVQLAPEGPHDAAAAPFPHAGSARASRPGTPNRSDGSRLVDVHPVTESATIGRAPGNDIVLADLLVSRNHARVQSDEHGARLEDLNSGNGSYVNGHRVSRPCPLQPGDLIGIGNHLLRFDGSRLLQYEESGGVAFGADGLSVTLASGQCLLHDVSFSLPRQTLMAIVGPSGAGKSTLLNALTASTPASTGTVTYAGRDLHDNHAQITQRIGVVPQQDILHPVLTVEQALRYGARLRFPPDTTEAERRTRIEQVARELSLTQQLTTRIDRLSGGERKRASTALELLTKPALLFLDEPTSGLDTDLDRELMHQLRSLTDEGRTVICVTHNLTHLDVCDVVLIMAKGGHVAYLGTPAGALSYFGVTTWTDLFGLLKTRHGEEWAARFHDDPHRDTRSFPPRTHPSTPPAQPPEAASRRSSWHQLPTLIQRYVAVIAADRTLMAILLLLPALLAAISHVVPGSRGLSHEPGNSEATQLLLVLVVGACLMGAAGAVREIAKERPIYNRERATGLTPGTYLASKVITLGGLAMIQGACLTVLALAGRPAPPDELLLGSASLELVAAMALVTVVSATIGLLISALVKDENQAMPILVLITMAQLVLCGGLVPVLGRAGLEQLSWLLPARWGFAAVGATVDLTYLGAPGNTSDTLWQHTPAAWLFDLAILIVLGAAAVQVTVLLLRRSAAPAIQRKVASL
ncbi:MAG: FHA domain-containing protein, partial [Dermatophilaceae bacterium]